MNSRHIFCETIWMKRLKGASVTVLKLLNNSTSRTQDTIDELVEFALNVGKFNQTSLSTKSTVKKSNADDSKNAEKEEKDNSPSILVAAGEIDVSFTSIEIINDLATTNSDQQQSSLKKRWIFELESISSIAKYSLVRPGDTLKAAPTQHFSVLEIETCNNNNASSSSTEKFLVIGSSAHNTSLLLDAACILWKRHHDLLESELFRAIFKSRPPAEALHLIASFPFECYGVISAGRVVANKLFRKGNNSNIANYLNSNNNKKKGGEMGDDGHNINTNEDDEESTERSIRIEVTPDGFLQMWLLPKDFSAMKYSDLRASAPSPSPQNQNRQQVLLINGETPVDPASLNYNNTPLGIQEQYPRCVIDFASLIDCRITGSSKNTSDSSSNENESDFYTNANEIRTTKEEDHQLIEENGESSAMNNDASSVSTSTLLLVFPDAMAFQIYIKKPAKNTSHNSNNYLLNVSSITQIFYACCAARPWLQPALSGSNQSSNSNSVVQSSSTLNLETLIPGAISPFTTKEIAQCHDLYCNVQKELANNNSNNLIQYASAAPSSFSTFTSRFSSVHNNPQQQQQEINSSSSSSSTNFAAISIQDIPVVFKTSVVSKNSEASHDIFMRKVLECCFTACYTNVCTELWLMPEAMRLLNFSDFLFAKYVLERGGVNLRLMMIFGGIARSFFHRGTSAAGEASGLDSASSLRNFLAKAVMQSDEEINSSTDDQQQLGTSNKKSKNKNNNNGNTLLSSSSSSSPFGGNNKSSAHANNFDLSIWKKVLRTLYAANAQSSTFFTAASTSSASSLQLSNNNNNNSFFGSSNGVSSSFAGASSGNAAKRVDGEAEALWQCAISTYGENVWENKMSALKQFLALIKIAHDLPGISTLLSDFEELLKNSSEGVVFVTTTTIRNPNKNNRNSGDKFRNFDNDDDDDQDYYDDDDEEDDEEVTTTTKTAIRASNICPSSNSIAISPGHRKYNQVLQLYQGIHLCLHSHQNNVNNNNSNINKGIPDFAFSSPQSSPRTGNYHQENEYMESFYGDDDDVSRHNNNNIKNNNNNTSSAGIANSSDRIDPAWIKDRIPEKVIYDLTKNRIRTTVLNSTDNNNSNNANRNNSNNNDFYDGQEDYFGSPPKNAKNSKGDEPSSSSASQQEPSLVSKILAKITLQNLKQGVFFTDYAESYFSQIRREFGISDSILWDAIALPKIKASLCFANYSGVHSMVSSGRSKCLLSRSHDGRFILKEIPFHEVSVLRRILPAYLGHVRKFPATTLLPRYLALYKLATYQDSNESYTYVAVMENIFAKAERAVDVVYDLKGSMVGRESEPDFLEKGVAAKDHEFVTNPGRGPICIPAKFRNSLLRQLYFDAKFLEQVNAMDYSLLVGIHHVVVDDDGSKNNDNEDDDSEDPDLDLVDQEVRDACNFNIQMEECPVHRITDYCQDKASGVGGILATTTTSVPSSFSHSFSMGGGGGGGHSSFSSGGGIIHNPHNNNNNNNSNFQRGFHQNFFGGLPAFALGTFVDKISSSQLYLPDGTWPSGSANNNNNISADPHKQSQPHANLSGDPSGRRFTPAHPKFIGNNNSKNKKNQVVTEIIYCGLVDTLTAYDYRKKVEFVAKGYVLMKDMANVSCAPAATYANRFLNFIAKDVFVPAVEL